MGAPPGARQGLGRADVLGKWTSLVVVFLIAARINVGFGLTVGLLAAMLFMPVWLSCAWRFRYFPTLAMLSVLSVLAGWWLAIWSSSSHEVLTRSAIEDAALVATLVVGVGAFLWAKALSSTRAAAIAFALGCFLAIRPNENFISSPWRFGFSLPVILLVFALTYQRSAKATEVLMGAALLLVSAAAGGRSRTGILLLVLVVLVWQTWPPPRARGLAVLRMGAVILALSIGVLQLGQALVLEGYLGEAARERTELQLEQSGSVLLGGRPEVAATGALFQDSPQGFGLGVRPNGHDLAVAKQGLAQINYDPNNGYVERYMFGTTFELHSVVGDLWASMGLLGLLLAVLIAALLGLLTLSLISSRGASALALFAAFSGLWNLLFSPFDSSLALLIVGLAVLLTSQGARRGRSVTQGMSSRSD